jgi:hypothetical protein
MKAVRFIFGPPFGFRDMVSENPSPESLDHLIRPQQQRLRDGEAEGFGGLDVDDELQLR